VASLEAKLKTTPKALKDAYAARISTDKAAKAAEARASKAEKDLAEVAQKQATLEGAVIERLDAIVASIGSKFFDLPLYPATVLPVNMLLLAYLYFHDAAEQIGEVMKLRLECAKDPLLDSIDVLESNWQIVRDVLQWTRHVLPHLFVGLFPKKKDEMPVGNIRKLVEAFDTLEGHVLQMKLSSVKQGVKGTIALTQSHGEEVDWEKAKEYAPKLVSLIHLVPAPLASMPSSIAPTPMDPAPAKVAWTSTCILR
jgi:hypothetical protein